MPDQNLPQRALKTTLQVATLFAVIFALRGEMTIALGLALGAMLGLFSLWTLTVAIPRLFTSGDPTARFWLGLLTALKLPIYMIVLNFTMTSKSIAPFAVFCGVALVPLIIVLKVVGYQLLTDAFAGRREAPASSLGD